MSINDQTETEGKEERKLSFTTEHENDKKAVLIFRAETGGNTNEIRECKEDFNKNELLMVI